MVSKQKLKIKEHEKKTIGKRVTEKIIGCDGNVIMLEYEKNHAPKIKILCGV